MGCGQRAGSSADQRWRKSGLDNRKMARSPAPRGVAWARIGSSRLDEACMARAPARGRNQRFLPLAGGITVPARAGVGTGQRLRMTFCSRMPSAEDVIMYSDRPEA